MATARALKAPTNYYGGKQKIAPLIVSALPPHETYVEVFGGAGSVLFAKPPSPLEVFNDIDLGVWSFFRVLRDPRHAKRLQDLLTLTPYSRQEYEECYASWRNTDDEIEMARRWFVAIQQGFAGTLGSCAWGYTKSARARQAHAYRGYIEGITGFAQRLKYVQLERLDFRKLILQYDSPTSLFYCDPPYDPNIRVLGGNRYICEMTHEDHEHLLALLRSIQGMAIVSGYDSDLYSERLRGWTKITKTVYAHSAGHSKRPRRTECLWISPNATRRQLSLFD